MNTVMFSTPNHQQKNQSGHNRMTDKTRFDNSEFFITHEDQDIMVLCPYGKHKVILQEK